ncbi:efflux RND transporter periplasmic adaptor subunit [Massilia sp. TSP1-1-2]|uniref:efflux RND transporter periplasmic adaptor subunit n=1 Tax=Massilia sp. TSP1-1-2 TaxID=2804649 RepID=UPI003CF5AE23
MKKFKTVFLLSLAALAVGGAVMATRGASFGAAKAANARLAGTVLPSVGPLRDVIIAKGTVAYEHQLVLRSPVSGRIGAQVPREGSEVRRGQPLLQVQDIQDDSEASLRALDKRRAVAKLDALERELRVVRRLVEVGSSAAFDLEQKTVERDMAAKDIERANLDQARLVDKRAMGRLNSPLDGQVLAVAAVAGQLVNAGEELLTLVGGESRTVIAYLDAMDVERLHVGQAVVFSDQEDGGVRRAGRVKEIARAITPAQRQNAVKIVIAPLAPINDLRVAQQLYVEFIVLEEKSVLRVPRDRVYLDGKQKFVNVVTKDGVRARAVQTTRGDATYDRVVAGISSSDLLARRGQLARTAND